MGIILLCYLVMGLFSLNIQDEVGELVGQQQIFNDPASVYYQFMYYLGMLIGGAWHAVFGDFGVYGGRILSAITITATFYYVYEILKDHVNKWFIMLASLIAIALLPNRFEFHHNYLTALLTTISAYYLFLALKKEKTSYILISGILLGINVFSRVSNLALSGMILALIPFQIYHKDWKQTSRMFLFALSGFVVGILFILGVMAVLGHLNLFFDAVNHLFSTGNETDSNHEIGGLLFTYLSEYKTLLKYGVVLFAFPVLLLVLDRPLKNKPILRHAVIVFVVLASTFVFYRYSVSFYLLNAFSTFVLAYCIYHFRQNKEVVYLSVLALLIQYFQPLGGDFGFPNMAYNNLYLAFPLALGILFSIIGSSAKTHATKVALFTVLGLFCLTLLTRGTLNSLYYYNSKDNEHSWNLYCTNKTSAKELFAWTATYRPKIDKLNVYVNEELGKRLETVKNELEKYVQKDDYLLCIQHEPIIHYITETRPYLYNYWIWTYDPTLLQQQIVRAKEEIPALPVVLFSKMKEEEDHLLTSLETGEYDYEETFFANKNRNRILVDFIKNNHYRTVWENEHYCIMLPPEFKSLN